jgi:hypothetical protein
MFDSFGGVKHRTLREDATLYRDAWISRLHKMCCCLFSSSERREHHEHFMDAATVISYILQGQDIVMSDVLAAYVLLRGHQRRVHAARSAEVEYAEMQAGPGQGPLARAIGGKTLRPTSQSIRLHELQPSDLEVMDELTHFADFFEANYGWPLYVFKNLSCGFCRLCAKNPALCCKYCCQPELRAPVWQSSAYKRGAKPRHGGGTQLGDQYCYCNDTAMHLFAPTLRSEDILLTSYVNTLLRPRFYVALDRKTSSVVIAIRGTMSFEDVLTDVLATPLRLDVADLPPGSAYVHGGMLRCCMEILRQLETHGIINSLLSSDVPESEAPLGVKRPAWAGWPIVVLGHSLGAGCSVVLSILMREKYPALRSRLRCFSYAPPGGLLSRALSDYTESFVTAVFLGKDVIPRLTPDSIARLRDAMFHVLGATRRTKSYIMIHLLFPAAAAGVLETAEGEIEEPIEVTRQLQELLAGATLTSTVKGSVRRTGAGVPPTTVTGPTGHVHDPERPRGSVVAAATAEAEAMEDAADAQSAPPLHGADSSTAGPSEMTTVPVFNASSPVTSAGAGSSVAGGGPASYGSVESVGTNQKRTVTEQAAENPLGRMNLYPPKRLLHLTRVATATQPCAFMCLPPGPRGCNKHHYYMPTWSAPDELSEIACSPLMIIDHLPDRLAEVLRETNSLLKRGLHEGFCEPGLTPEAARQWRAQRTKSFLYSTRAPPSPAARHSPDFADLRTVAAPPAPELDARWVEQERPDVAAAAAHQPTSHKSMV